MIKDVRKKELISFLKKVHFNIQDLALLNIALTHASYLKETSKNKKLQDNERLEFFGDAVLKLFISEYLMKKYEDYSEGELSNLRAFVVSEKVLAQIAKKLNLNKYLLLGRNERLSIPDSILADSVEALLGVIYYECGIEKAKEFVLTNWLEYIESADRSKEKDNYKAVLQEYSQARSLGLPLYKIILETGPDHRKEFEVSVVLNNNELAKGRGKTKKAASQDAAKNALFFLNLI